MRIKRKLLLPMIVIGFVVGPKTYSDFDGLSLELATPAPSSSETSDSEDVGVEVEMSQSSSCDEKVGNRFISQEHLKKIFPFKGKKKFSDIKYDNKEKKLTFKVPPFFNGCMRPEFKVMHVDGEVFVAAVNNYDFSKQEKSYNAFVDQIKKDNQTKDKNLNDWKSLTSYQKYKFCLLNKGMLKLEKDKMGFENGFFTGGELNVEEVKKHISPGSTVTAKNLRVSEIDDSSIHFVSPVPSVENGNFSATNGEKISMKIGVEKEGSVDIVNACFMKENFGSDKLNVLNQGVKTKAEQQYFKVCAASTYDEAAKEFGHLESMGNFAKELVPSAQKIVDALREKRVEEIVEEMKDIGKELKKYKKMDEDEVEDLVNKFRKLSQQLTDVQINPSIKRLNRLIEERKGKSGKEREKINKKIKKLEKEIDVIASKGLKNAFKYAGRAAAEYNLQDDAKDIEMIRLRSKEYGKVAKSKKKYSVKTAKRKIKKGIKNLEREFVRWEKNEASKEGDYDVVRDEERYVRRVYERTQKRARDMMMNEMKMEREYCSRSMWTGSVKNPYRCKAFINNRGRRQASMSRYLARAEGHLRQRMGDLDTYRSNYDDYIREEHMREFGDYYDNEFGSADDFYGFKNNYFSNDPFMGTPNDFRTYDGSGNSYPFSAYGQSTGNNRLPTQQYQNLMFATQNPVYESSSYQNYFPQGYGGQQSFGNSQYGVVGRTYQPLEQTQNNFMWPQSNSYGGNYFNYN